MKEGNQIDFYLSQDLLKNQKPAYQSIKKAHTNSIESMAAHPSHKYFASGSHDRTIKIWDMGKLKQTATLSDHKEGVWSLDYSQDGGLLVSGSPDKSVLIWDSKKQAPGQRLQGHKDKVYCAKINENDKLIASIGEGAELLIWDIANASKPIKSIDLHSTVGYDISWANNGKHLFVTAKGGKVFALDSKSFNIISQDTVGNQSDIKVEGVCANQQTLSGRVFCGSELGHIAWYKSVDGKLKKETEFAAHVGGCRNVTLHPHKKYLLSSGKDGSVRLWDCSSEGHPQIISNLVFHSENVTSPIFIGDDFIVTGSWDENIGVWRFEDTLKQ